MRQNVARNRADCATNCMPTRMADSSGSRPNGLSTRSRRHLNTMSAEMIDSTAFSTNTHCVPALAINAPATIGPTMRDTFIDTPFSASAAGNWALGTSSGVIAANTGQRIASPMPLKKISTSSNAGVIRPDNTAAHSSSATAATHSCVNRK